MEAMMAAMGLPVGFETTKGKQVEGIVWCVFVCARARHHTALALRNARRTKARPLLLLSHCRQRTGCRQGETEARIQTVHEQEAWRHRKEIDDDLLLPHLSLMPVLLRAENLSNTKKKMTTSHHCTMMEWKTICSWN
jgi:hypothetical protein